MRAFVVARNLVANFSVNKQIKNLTAEIEFIKSEMEEILADQNDINESTRAQLDAISTALAELQSNRPESKPRRPIGFVQPDEG